MSVKLLFHILCGFLMSFALILSPASPSARIPGFPPFLEIGSFAQYEQAFSNNETHELYWCIEGVNSSGVEITIRSHGIRFNNSDRTYYVHPGGAVMLVNATSWTILRAILHDEIDVTEQYVGYKIPFWIPTTINESTPIDTLYDDGIHPSSYEGLEIDALPEPRDCWVTNRSYGLGNTMTRWYDKKTGVVLLIQTSFSAFASHISVTETLNDTNIQPLLFSYQSAYDIGIATGLFLIALTMAVAIYYRTKKPKQLGWNQKTITTTCIHRRSHRYPDDVRPAQYSFLR